MKNMTLSLLGLLNPINLLIVGAPLLTSAFQRLESYGKEQKAAEKAGKLSEARTIALRAAQRQTRSGTFDEVKAVGEAEREAARKGLDFSQADVKAIIDAIARGVEAQKPEVKKDPRDHPALKEFDSSTDAMKEYTANFIKLGRVRDDEIELTKKLTAELKKKGVESNLAIANAVEERQNARKAQTEAEKNKKFVDNAFDFTSSINSLKEKLKLEEKLEGATEKTKAFQRRVNELTEQLKDKFGAGAAGRAEQQAKLEAELAEKRKKKEPKGGLSRTDGAIGEVTRARSLQAGLKRQQRQEEQRAKKLENETFRQGKHLQDISEAINNFNVSFN